MTVQPSFVTSLISGGVAGIAVDVALFPLDTLKTRLQSPSGFLHSGGFTNLYKGLGTAAIGSAPIAAIFFCTYDTIKKCSPQISEVYHPFLHMGAACIGEIVSCLVKVPIEVVKQRSQAEVGTRSSLDILRRAVAMEGVRGLYRGFGSTVVREIPFVLLQFPLWEFFKTRWKWWKGAELGVGEVAACGAVSGGISAAVTTPLDVAKTKIMLCESHKEFSDPNRLRISRVLKNTYLEHGVKGLFAGFTPRVMWITLGGAVFFGVYEATRGVCCQFPWGVEEPYHKYNNCI